MKQVALTTTDNPYDYFTDFDRWRHFDEDEKRYFTLGYIARIAKIDPLLPPAILEQIWEEAIDEICKFNLTGNYKKIFREV
jgi:hypothetical protein